jgi:hypothetical protein
MTSPRPSTALAASTSSATTTSVSSSRMRPRSPNCWFERKFEAPDGTVFDITSQPRLGPAE